jgi:hypothetical protein
MRAELTYGGAFFDSQKDTSFISASIVIPRVLSLCNPKSVADFGRGVGTWCAHCLTGPFFARMIEPTP